MSPFPSIAANGNGSAKNATPNPSRVLDSSNWATISSIIKSGDNQRADALKLTVFDQILIANAEARSKLIYQE